MEIVYCGGCGKVLREGDFPKGLARFQDNRPYCSECAPPEPVPIPTPPPAAGAPAKKSGGSSSRLQRVPSGTHRAVVPAPKGNTGVLIGAAVAGGVVLLLAVFVALGQRPTSPPPERTALPAPPRPPSPPSADGSELERKVRELEARASGTADPEGVLRDCDALRGSVRGTPLAARLAAVESAAEGRMKAALQSAKVDLALKNARDLEARDLDSSRVEEIRSLFRSALAIAGPRSPEIESARAAYEKRLLEGPARGREGPLQPEPAGFIRDWLLLGIFPNPEDAGLDRDYLGGETRADPRGGDRVEFGGGLRVWKGIRSPEAGINLHAFGLGIPNAQTPCVTYAFCLLQVDADMEGELRVGSDDGIAVWMDGREVGRVHQHRASAADQDRWAVKLPKGWHRILLKIEQGDGDYGFHLRFTDPGGNPLPGLRIWR